MYFLAYTKFCCPNNWLKVAWRFKDNYNVQISLKKVQSYLGTVQDHAMFKECDKTLSCILFKISFSFLSPSCDLTFLAVLTETAPRTSYNGITLGHLFISWILPLEFKAKWRIVTAYLMVFSDSFSSMFLIQESLISSGFTILSSLLTILSSLHLFCLLWLKCSRHKVHMQISFGALVFVYWFSARENHGGMDVDQTQFFSAAWRKGSLTPNCVKQGISSAPELSSRQARATWNLGICYKILYVTSYRWIQHRSSLLINFRWMELLVQLLCAPGGTRQHWSAGC